jgi:hypothetical protein
VLNGAQSIIGIFELPLTNGASYLPSNKSICFRKSWNLGLAARPAFGGPVVVVRGPGLC